MQVELRVRNTDLADALRGYIERRLGLSFGRFGDQVGRIRVRVSGLNGPRGGTKKSCRISADLKPFGRIAVHETDLDLHAAIDGAASRVGRLLGQRLEKEKELTYGSEAARSA
jgi:putative sigma-54 modulation protein